MDAEVAGVESRRIAPDVNPNLLLRNWATRAARQSREDQKLSTRKAPKRLSSARGVKSVVLDAQIAVVVDGAVRVRSVERQVFRYPFSPQHQCDGLQGFCGINV